MEWDNGYVLGYEPMDDTHREFVECVGNLQQCADDDIPHRLDRLIEHLGAHFDEENTLMETTEFPPRACHVDEHAAVMRSATDIRKLVDEGDRFHVRRFAEALAEWFPGHATHLDSALAHWLVKRQHGGKPVVFRRLQFERTAL
ncbi:hemerythrin domain-containing protein [Caballeronia sp. LZ035]|uniref:bacteriohemerythrin n=1 Tax=Caballeronia sp. LZ035 TaxID=3038568 RepID=UPI00285D54D3|nr:hemerythrin domain-containing protein [Caballeronia sp. LZ035]MDR5761017.1 hemerythrin domain-containing protein [Caballeronia sp. LZ035]